MGRLIERSDVYNAIQITSDKFGIAKQPAESAMRSMLSQIPSVSAIRIPENATNGDVLTTIFPNLNFTNVLAKMYAQNGKMLSDWWNAPYRETEVSK